MIGWLLLYLMIGATNYLFFLTEGNAMLAMPKHRKAGLAEAAFFVLCWPAQLLFAILVGVNTATDWLLGKLMG